MNSRIRIDAAFLLQHFGALVQVKRKHLTWDEFGENLERNFQGASRQMRTRSGILSGKADKSKWSLAKRAVYEAVAGNDPDHEGIRQRLGNPQEPETPQLLSTISLWLAGMLGISVSMTRPMAAVMLYAVGEAESGWAVLLADDGVSAPAPENPTDR